MANEISNKLVMDKLPEMESNKKFHEKNNFENEKQILLKHVLEKLPFETTILMTNIAKQFSRSNKIKSELVPFQNELLNNSDLSINALVNNLPHEALHLLKNIVTTYKTEISGTTNNKAIRSQPKILQRVIKQKKALELFNSSKTEEERLTIYESGVALGLVVGSSSRKDVVSIMKEHSNVIYNIDSNEPIFFYDDLSVSIFFDVNNIVNEVQFGNKFKGETCRGLKVGDSISTAIELYGEPRMKSAKAVLWSHFSIFCLNNRIRCIRIQN